MLTPGPKTKTEKLNWMYASDAMMQTEREIQNYTARNMAYPADWDEIWKTRGRPHGAVKVTIWLDADVVRFFKGLGSGYHARINRILRAFMHFRLARIINGPDTTDYVLRPDEVLRKAQEGWTWGKTEDLHTDGKGAVAKEAERQALLFPFGKGELDD